MDQPDQTNQSEQLTSEIIAQPDVYAYLVCAEMALSEARRAIYAAARAKLAPFGDSAADTPVVNRIRQISRDVHNLRRTGMHLRRTGAPE